MTPTILFTKHRRERSLRYEKNYHNHSVSGVSALPHLHNDRLRKQAVFFDTTYTFETAIIMLPNGEIIEGKVESWGDYADGDQIQVKIDGKTYLVHSSNTCLIAG